MDITLSNVPAFRKKEAIEKAKKEAVVHSLVLKVIKWKSGDIAFSQTQEKITAQEWRKYCKHTEKTNLSLDAKQIKAKLKSIKETIEKNNGFE